MTPATVVEPTHHPSYHRQTQMPPKMPSAGGDGPSPIVIILISSFGSAILIACLFLIIYFFRYTSSGRIFLDRIGRPGEYDDEQAFAREEAEALETMDDMQRTEYLRAKGTPLLEADGLDLFPRHVLTLNSLQLSSPRILPSRHRQTFLCRNILRYRKRVYRHGSLNLSWRLPTALLRAGQRSSSSTRNAPS